MKKYALQRVNGSKKNGKIVINLKSERVLNFCDKVTI
jgi:hypothetical protein